MAKRRTVALKNGADLCAALCQLDDARRHELGVEAICRLATEVAALRVQVRDEEAPAELIDRHWAIVCAVSAQTFSYERTAKVTKDMLVWMCLRRAIGWMRSLVRIHSKGRWEEVQEMIVAWLDAWGTDARAKYAQARFTTLTGIVRGATEEHHAYMHSALIRALSDVQA
jgi:hypothetical protein